VLRNWEERENSKAFQGPKKSGESKKTTEVEGKIEKISDEGGGGGGKEMEKMETPRREKKIETPSMFDEDLREKGMNTTLQPSYK